jgi:hypothetical protein
MFGEEDEQGRKRFDSFTGMYIAPMDRTEGLNDTDRANRDATRQREGRSREVTGDDIAASYKTQEYGTDVYSGGELVSHTVEGYYLVPSNPEQADPQTWYYMSRDIGAPHGMVYDPIGGYIYEINQVPGQSLLEQLEGLIINSMPSNNVKVNVSVAYQYKRGSAEWSSLWKREEGNSFLLSPVRLTDPATATAWFQGQAGKEWPYNLSANNCAHYSVQGLNAGGAGINFLGPLPSNFSIAPTMTWTAGQSYPVPIGK